MAKYQTFQRQQRLHPEYAGIYADEFIKVRGYMNRPWFASG